MTRTSICILGVLVAACDFNLEKAADFLTGREANRVVLSSQPIVLTQEATTFSSNEPMKVIGEATFVCVVLRDGVVLQDQRVMDQLFTDALRGAKINVAVLSSDGKRVTLPEPMQGWAKFGRVLPNNELSACGSMRCEPLPPGTLISQVEISSTPELRIRGVYWESDKSPMEKRQELLERKSASETSSSKNCKS
jgi:hypothetical protein